MANIQTITKEELLQKIERKDPIQIVNVLDPKYYHLGAIRGSLKIPVSELNQRYIELDKTKEVVTYCAHSECHASRQGAEKLAELGFNVKAYEGGIKEWKESGLPAEETAQQPQQHQTA